MATINWTNLITNIGGVVVIVGALWKASRVIERAIRDSERSKTQAEDRAKAERATAQLAAQHTQSLLRAQQERISVLEGLAEIHVERFDQIEEYLAQSPEERIKRPYTRRKANPRLEGKALQRYKEIDTDFT